ncbi:hypothetical protein RJ639_034262 [Escallonia herrerae]|uniref:Uncharacterized protein n=1 Tax=Escallonia herrerae TaxID=1293975 RepID=A0AA88WVV2_9ASTE|nr:hypothetical protein RJ639_034262 [Escallonia herrerae]
MYQVEKLQQAQPKPFTVPFISSPWNSTLIPPPGGEAASRLSSTSENGPSRLEWSAAKTRIREGSRHRHTLGALGKTLQGLLSGQISPYPALLPLLATPPERKSTRQHIPSQLLLKARSVNTWECFSPEGFALNSKWNDAEKYICNPLSGEVPLECLSAKTLSGRSFRNLTNRITMSAPLIYSSQSRLIHTKPSITITHHENEVHIPTTKEKKVVGNMMTRDVGTQSTPPELTSSSPSPASTPPIQERSTKRNLAEGGDSLNSSPKLEEVEGKETREKEETKGKAKKQICRFRCRRGGGCLLSLVRNMWMGRRRHREKHKPQKKNIFPRHAS